jgi:ankyrin repeat protein
MGILKNVPDKKVTVPPISEAEHTENLTNSSLEKTSIFIASIFKTPPDFLTSDVFDIGLNIDETDRNGFTRLSWAANLGCYDLVCKYLQAGANPNIIDNSGNNALLRALHSNFFKIVDLLLKNNANPNTINKVGESAFSLAISKNFFKIALLLLNHRNIDVNTKAHQDAFLEIVQRSNRYQPFIILFIKKGLDKKILGKGLVQAFHDGAADTVSLLIDSGANLELNALNSFGLMHTEEKATVTPLDYALAKKDLASIAKLLLAGATLNEPRKLYTFLMDAANKKTKNSIFSKSKSLPISINAADLYNSLSVLIKKENELRLLQPKSVCFLTEDEYKKLQLMYNKMEIVHQGICNVIDQATHFPDTILDIIDEYHHPHGHLKPK